MFALEISHREAPARREIVCVQRPQAVIGAGKGVHVAVDELREAGCQLRLVRELGRSFRCEVISQMVGTDLPDLKDGLYHGWARFEVGQVVVEVFALDLDLLIRAEEPPDRAGVRVLREAVKEAEPKFPAVVISGGTPSVVSFVRDQPVLIGRSGQCSVRLDAAEVSAQHARVGYDGDIFWVEDLGSTNGTFVSGQQVSGRIPVPARTPIIIGREIAIILVASAEELRAALTFDPLLITKPSQRRYPVLIAVAEVVRPARVVLPVGQAVAIGRDPSSDIWLGAPHISRKHCEIVLQDSGAITITDQSTNGTAIDGVVLVKGESISVQGTPKVLNFGGDLTIALCFESEQEEAYLSAHGAADVFGGSTSDIRSIAPSERGDSQALEPIFEHVALGSSDTICRRGVIQRAMSKSHMLYALLHPSVRWVFWIAVLAVVILVMVLGWVVVQRF